MALEGSIRDFSLADIFQLIGIQRKTGVLTLKNDEKDEEVKVSFLNGMVVNADSKTKRLDDRLGTVLVKTGKIGPNDLKKALKIQKETLKKVGTVLVEEKLVRPEDLRDALGIQITQIIYRLFRWKDGQYHFAQDVGVDYDKENFTPMSAESILMEGMRMIDEWPIIERKITSFDMVFERVALAGAEEPVVEEGSPEEDSGGGGKEDDFDLIFGGDKGKKGKAAGPEASKKIKLTREENGVYQQVDGKATVQEIIERSMASEFETCRALFDLTNRNLIAPVAGVVGKPGTSGKTASRVEVGAYVGKALYLAIAAALVVSVSLWRTNPLNLLTPPPLKSAPVERLREELATTQVRRVASAIDVYVLVNHAYPGTAQDLVKDGILAAPDLLDSWGRPIGFEVKPDRIVISAPTGPTAEAPLVTEERLLRG